METEGILEKRTINQSESKTHKVNNGEKKSRGPKTTKMKLEIAKSAKG